MAVCALLAWHSSHADNTNYFSSKEQLENLVNQKYMESRDVYSSFVDRYQYHAELDKTVNGKSPYVSPDSDGGTVDERLGGAASDYSSFINELKSYRATR